MVSIKTGDSKTSVFHWSSLSQFEQRSLCAQWAKSNPIIALKFSVADVDSCFNDVHNVLELLEISKSVRVSALSNKITQITLII